ncbi:MAG: TolC family protein, partial [Planctomycetota bacterium]
LTNLEYPDCGLGLQLSIPIGNNAARGARDRAMLVLEQARRRLYAAELDVSREVRAALRNLVTLAESIRASRESVRLSETQLDTERERLRVGRGTIFEVQQRNQELLEARQRLLRNQLDYRISESRLDYVQGDLSVGPAVPEPADAR